MSSASYIPEKPLINNSMNVGKKSQGYSAAEGRGQRVDASAQKSSVPDSLTVPSEGLFGPGQPDAGGVGVSVREVLYFLCVCVKRRAVTHTDDVLAGGDEPQTLHVVHPGFVAGKLRRRLTLPVEKQRYTGR